MSRNNYKTETKSFDGLQTIRADNIYADENIYIDGVAVLTTVPTTTVASTSTFTDNKLIRADGTSRNIQTSGVTVDDSNNITGVNNLTVNTTLTAPDIVKSSSTFTDNKLIRADGTAKNVQTSGITLDDSDNLSNITSINVTGESTIGTSTGSVALKCNKFTSIGANDSIFIDANGSGGVVIDTITNSGVRMRSGATNPDWISNLAYQLGSDRAIVWGTFIDGEYKPNVGGHAINGSEIVTAWASFWLNFQQTIGSHCVIVGNTSSATALTNGNAFYVTGPMESTGALRVPSIIVGSGTITGVTSITCTNVSLGGNCTLGSLGAATINFPATSGTVALTSSVVAPSITSSLVQVDHSSVSELYIGAISIPSNATTITKFSCSVKSTGVSGSVTYSIYLKVGNLATNGAGSSYGTIGSIVEANNSVGIFQSSGTLSATVSNRTASIILEITAGTGTLTVLSTSIEYI